MLEGLLVHLEFYLALLNSTSNEILKLGILHYGDFFYHFRVLVKFTDNVAWLIADEIRGARQYLECKDKPLGILVAKEVALIQDQDVLCYVCCE